MWLKFQLKNFFQQKAETCSSKFFSFCWLAQITSRCDVEQFFVPNFFSCSHFGTYLTYFRSFCKFYVCFAELENIVFWLKALNAYCFQLCTFSWSICFPASTNWWVKLMFSFVRFEAKNVLFWAKNVYYHNIISFGWWHLFESSDAKQQCFFAQQIVSKLTYSELRFDQVLRSRKQLSCA